MEHTGRRGLNLAATPTVLGDGARFLVERELGRGAFATVYAARDRRSGQSVALKLWHSLDATALDQVRREVAMLASVAHPNVVRVLGLFEDDGEHFLCMERVEGVPLTRWVRAERECIRNGCGPKHSLPGAFGAEVQQTGSSRYSAPQPAGIARLRAGLRQLAEGVKAIHAAGLVHRDLRPANVRVTERGRVVVLDFGIAAAGAEGEAGPVGTAAYMAPEQWSGEPVPASDWYSVGVLAFEALTGELPFSGTAQEVIVKKRTLSAPRVSHLVEGVPEELDVLVSDLLAPRPETRARAAERLLQHG